MGLKTELIIRGTWRLPEHKKLTLLACVMLIILKIRKESRFQSASQCKRRKRKLSNNLFSISASNKLKGWIRFSPMLMNIINETHEKNFSKRQARKESAKINLNSDVFLATEACFSLHG